MFTSCSDVDEEQNEQIIGDASLADQCRDSTI